MKIYWHDGALNLRPETEEDGAITSAILFAYGSSDLGNVVLEVATDSIRDGANQQRVVAIDVPFNGGIQSVSGDIETHKPLGK